MVEPDDFDFLDLDTLSSEEEWFIKFANIKGGPIAKCLILTTLLKK